MSGSRALILENLRRAVAVRQEEAGREPEKNIKINQYASAGFGGAPDSGPAEPAEPLPTWTQPAAEALIPALEASGAVARVSRSPEDLARDLAWVVREYGVKSVAAWRHPLLEWFGAAEILDGLGVEVWQADLADQAADSRGHQETASAIPGRGVCRQAEGMDLGLCAAEAVLAATGTVVLAPGPGRPRSTALLPPVFLVLADPAMVMSDLRAFLPLAEAWRTESAPSGIFCVTGPSATGDIEFVLVRGAHGPPTVIVLLVDF